MAILANKSRDKIKLNEAVIAPATGALVSQLVLHIVGPTKKDGLKKLEKCYENLFSAIEAHNKSRNQPKILRIAIPCFSTGYNGFEKTDAAEIAIKEARAFLKSNPGCQITFIAFGNPDSPKNRDAQPQGADKENYDVYQYRIEGSNSKGKASIESVKSKPKDNIKVIFGNIENMRADVIVNPMGEDFTYSPISRCVFEKGAQLSSIFSVCLSML